MANTKSSKKAILVNERNRVRNVHFKSTMKTLIKVAAESIKEKKEEADDKVKKAARYIDKLVTKGILKKKTAGNKKSSLMKLYSKILQNTETNSNDSKETTKVKTKEKKAGTKAKKTAYKNPVKKEEIKKETEKKTETKSEKKTKKTVKKTSSATNKETTKTKEEKNK